MSWESEYQPRIDADIAALTPLHDFVLVQAFPPADLIINPGVHMTRDYRWRSNRPTGLRYGTVVATGKGDRLFAMVCRCEGTPIGMGETATVPVTEFLLRLETAKSWDCSKCGSRLIHVHAADERAEMHCKVGDVVIYPRVPANDVEINGEVYTFLHEEQHVLAVVDERLAA